MHVEAGHKVVFRLSVGIHHELQGVTVALEHRGTNYVQGG